MSPLPDLRLPALRLAPLLLGVRLIHEEPGGRLRSGIIVETEAYPGGDDRASHTWGGRRTPRTDTMYLEGGAAYVYRIYGMHDCLNVVSGPKDSGEAVLIRALIPEDGIDIIRASRPGVRDRDLLRGPGRLCRGMSIDRTFDRSVFGDGPLRLEPGSPDGPVSTAPRIGIERSGEWSHRPWRFLAGPPEWWSVKPRSTDGPEADP